MGRLSKAEQEKRKFHFTDRRLRDIELPSKLDREKSKHVIYYDTHQPGLRFLVTHTGNKSYQFQMWSSKLQKPLTQTIGKFSKISLKQAREDAAKLATEIHSGIDVEKKKALERQAILVDPTVKDFCQRFLDEHKNIRTNKRKKSWDADQAMLENKVIPIIGRLKLSKVRKADIKNILKKAAEKKSIKQDLENGKSFQREIGGAVSRNRLLSCLKTMFNFAVEEEVIPFNPCNGLKKLAESPRDRSLKEEEIRALFDKLGDSVSDKLIKFLLVTGQRSSECREMEWSELDESVWVIPSNRTKNGKIHEVPLSSMAMEILNSIEREGKYVFAVDGKPLSRHCLPQRFRRLNVYLNWESKVTPHDLRRTCRTIMSRIGIRPHVSERVLNHAVGGMERTYDTYKYMDEKKKALQKYADKLALILDFQFPKNNVVDIKTGTAL